MKKALIVAAVAAMLFSCKTSNRPAGRMVDVTGTFTFDITEITDNISLD